MKITILDRASLGDDTPIDILNEIGEVEVFDATPPELVSARIAESDIIILNKVKITHEIIESARNLKQICVFATGYDNIDLATAKECGVAVCNVPGYSTDSVALFTVATVLSLVAHLSEYNQYIRSGDYLKSGVPNRLIPVYHEIRGKTWGIIGYGNIGKAVGRVAEAMGARLIVNKRPAVEGVECVDIDTLCRESDIITIHCPLNDQTRNLINSERIDLMKKDVVVVNEARGAVVNENDIAEAVINDRIGAFGCDVYSVEPFSVEHPYNKIMNKSNVLLTPHPAWGAYEARARCIGIIKDNILAYLWGKTLNRVDI